MKNIPIDFVVPWLDSTDPVWQKNLQEYKINSGIYEDSTDKRYRDWGLFKYWFRGVEKYAPWVNKVHLITCGHYPDWLDLNHPKLNFVKHEDYIPKEFLPVFSVNPIEVNLHRIQSLSEHFVYFNDDIYIKSPLSKDWFFKNGTPCDFGVMNAFSGSGFTKMIMNSAVIINKYKHKRTVMKEAPLKWFNYKYGSQTVRNILLLPWTEFTGFYDYHLANAYLKSTFEEVWEKEEKLLLDTTSRKFRHNLDLTQSVFRYWQLASNNFVPIQKYKLGDYYMVGKDPLDKVLKSLNSKQKPLICLNDYDPEDLDYVIKTLEESFKILFPNKSSFEI